MVDRDGDKMSDLVVDNCEDNLVDKARMSDIGSDTSDDSDKMVPSDTDNQLINACEKGNLAQAQQAVDHGALVNCLDSAGWTPVMWAIRYNHHSVAEWLLALPVNVNCGLDGLNLNTLQLASAVCTNSKIVTTVATMTDNPNAVSNDGWTAVQRAVFYGNMSAVMGLLPILQIDWNAKHEKHGSLLDIAR